MPAPVALEVMAPRVVVERVVVQGVVVQGIVVPALVVPGRTRGHRGRACGRDRASRDERKDEHEQPARASGLDVAAGNRRT
jgi:hypothetical protein